MNKADVKMVDKLLKEIKVLIKRVQSILKNPISNGELPAIYKELEDSIERRLEIWR